MWKEKQKTCQCFVKVPQKPDSTKAPMLLAGFFRSAENSLLSADGLSQVIYQYLGNIINMAKPGVTLAVLLPNQFK